MARPLLQRFVASAIARELVVVVARTLGHRGVPIMPLKGVLAQATLYDDPTARELVDVDVLVPSGTFPTAARALRAAGFRPERRRMSHEQSFVHPDLPLPVDVHARLFPHFRYRMPTDSLFRRGTRDPLLFGVPVWLPDPLDTVAHLVGHLATPNADAPRTDKYARDLALLVQRTPLGPSEAAAHLVRCGLARAARYALPMLRERGDADFAGRVMEALPGDPVGAALASVARSVVRGGPPGAMRGTLPCYLLSQSVPHAGLALATAIFDRAWHGIS